MALTNYERLIQLANEVFAAKTDPDQLDVDFEVMERLKKLHPATISEYADGNGPVAWVLVIPTTTELMHQFLELKIGEKELFEFTPIGAIYNSIYLCSALTLVEYRRQGIVKKLTLDAIAKIRCDHPIKHLFVWPFSHEGHIAAETIAGLSSLPLYIRESKHE